MAEEEDTVVDELTVTEIVSEESFLMKSSKESYRNLRLIGGLEMVQLTHRPQMKCSENKLVGERSFICLDCAKENSILCIDCALACHFLHTIKEITVEAPDFTCDCGNPRSSDQQICLFFPTKKLNGDNIYVIRRLKSKPFTEDDGDRQHEFLVRSSHLYVKRASNLYSEGHYIEAMSDMNKAISWDEPHISSEICDMARRWAQSPDVTTWLFTASEEFRSAVKQLDYKNIMPSLEVFRKFCKCVRCLYAVIKKKSDMEGKEILDDMTIDDALALQYNEFHATAASFDEIEIVSLLQYDHYMKYVKPIREDESKCNAKLMLLEMDANKNDIGKMQKNARERGFEVRVRNPWD